MVNMVVYDQGGAMEQIGSTEAKTKFGEILRRARAGETFVITQNGEEAGRLVPPGGGHREHSIRAPSRPVKPTVSHCTTSSYG